MRRVIASYEIVYRDAIKLSKGAKVSVQKREAKPEWVGWIWCVSHDGQSGWISESYLDIEGEKATLKQDYDAREASVQRDDWVEVLKEENGWFWIKKTDGTEGWIPGENLASE